MNLAEETLDRYFSAVSITDTVGAEDVINQALQKGLSPEDVVFKVIIPAIEKMVMRLTKDLDTTISQHYIASKLAEEITEKMIKKFKEKPKFEGSIVIGASYGDFHGLGKKIVTGCLRSHMYLVKDLGLSVSPEKFVNEAVSYNAQIIGISSMMVHTAKGENGSLKVRQILKERSLESKIKIMVGGAPYRFDENLYKAVCADGWAENGIIAGKIANKLIEEIKND